MVCACRLTDRRRPSRAKRCYCCCSCPASFLRFFYFFSSSILFGRLLSSVQSISLSSVALVLAHFLNAILNASSSSPVHAYFFLSFFCSYFLPLDRKKITTDGRTADSCERWSKARAEYILWRINKSLSLEGPKERERDKSITVD